MPRLALHSSQLLCVFYHYNHKIIDGRFRISDYLIKDDNLMAFSSPNVLL